MDIDVKTKEQGMVYVHTYLNFIKDFIDQGTKIKLKPSVYMNGYRAIYQLCEEEDMGAAFF